jgi:hypothetical protein
MCGKILNAETRPRHADVGKRTRDILRDVSRIQLERMFSQCREIEMNVEQRNELAQQVWAEYGRGPSAPMQMNDPATPRVSGDQLDFPDQPPGVSLDRF